MFVCICFGITEAQVEAAIDNGAVTMKELVAELGICRQCGECVRDTKQLLNQKLTEGK